MDSHSEKQSLILKRIGIDVWKLRQPVETDSALSEELTLRKTGDRLPEIKPSSESGYENSDGAGSEKVADSPVYVATEDQIHEKPTRVGVRQNESQLSSPVEGNMGSGETVKNDPHTEARQVRRDPPHLKEGIECAPTSATVRWRTELIPRAGAKWCFVCSFSSTNEQAERQLLDAMMFALNISDSDCSLLLVFPVHGNVTEPDQESSITDILSSFLEKEQPKTIIVLGEQLAHLLLGTDKSIDILRNENYRYQGGTSQLAVTFGLAHLLNNPMDKAKVWKDLQKI